MDERTPVWSRWYAEAGLPYRRAGSEIVFTDETHAIQAAVAGQGVALVSTALVADELASGALVVPFGPTLEGHGFHIVVPEGHVDRDVEAVRAWLTDAAADYIVS